ncbi:MAG: DUF2191 domain-containing protein [Alphaproteobacteria bacterium]
MKTTIDLPEPLLDEARRLAAKEGVTLKTLVERGLRHVVAAKARGMEFKLRDASFDGQGLQPGVENASWAEIRALAYEGRGG